MCLPLKTNFCPIMERLLSTYCGDLPDIASISGKSGNIVTDALRRISLSEMRSDHRGTKLTSSFAPHLPRSPLDKTTDCAICSYAPQSSFIANRA
jgi:hypothetical protein